jgi:hypothetical protein
MTRSETISLLSEAIVVATRQMKEAANETDAAMKAGIAAGMLSALDMVIDLDSLE